jgi:signal peptidase I
MMLLFMEDKILVNPQSIKQSFWEITRFVFIALIIVVPIRLFIAEPFVVSGDSMLPTFQSSNYLIVDKLSYKLSNPERGDVAIFRYPKDQTKFFIKRIIGLPNETIKINNEKVSIFPCDKINDCAGITLNEPYIREPFNTTQTYTTGNDEYFVMGDNRNASSDSRYWGVVNKKLLVGRAFLRLLPTNEIGIMPGDYKQTKI